MLVVGCSRQPEPEALSEPDQRIVCLVPSVTCMIVDLDMGVRIVGTGSWDAAAPAGAIAVQTQTIDYEALLALRPTDVVVSSGVAGPDVKLSEYADQGLFDLHDYPYPRDVYSALAMLTEPQGDTMSVAELLGISSEAIVVRKRIEDGLSRLREALKDRPSRRVLLAFGLDPVTASGPGSVNDELLGYVGAVNALSDGGQMVRLDHEGLIAASPDVILVLAPGQEPLSSTDDDRLARLRGLPVPALDQGRVAMLTDELILLPSTNLLQTAEAFALAIHPECADCHPRGGPW